MFFRRNITSLFVIQISNYISPLLVMPFLTRSLSVEGVGVVLFLIATGGLLAILFDHGSSNLSISYVSKPNRLFLKCIRARRVLVTSFIFKCVLLSLILILILFASHYSKLLDQYFVSVVMVILCGFMQSMQNVWVGLVFGNARNFAVSILVGRNIYLVAVILFIDSASKIDSVVLCWFFSNLVTMVLCIISQILVIRPGNIRVQRFLKYYTQSVYPYFKSKVFSSIYNLSGALLVGYYCGASQVAFFRVSEQFYRGAQGLTAPFISSLYPRLTVQPDPAVFKKIFIVLLMLVVSIASCIAIFSELLLFYIFGPEYVAGANYLQLFMLISVINFVGTICGLPLFALIGKPIMANRAVNFGALAFFFVIGVTYATSEVDVINVLLAILISELIVLVMRIYSFSRQWRVC